MGGGGSIVATYDGGHFVALEKCLLNVEGYIPMKTIHMKTKCYLQQHETLKERYVRVCQEVNQSIRAKVNPHYSV